MYICIYIYYIYICACIYIETVGCSSVLIQKLPVQSTPLFQTLNSAHFECLMSTVSMQHRILGVLSDGIQRLLAMLVKVWDVVGERIYMGPFWIYDNNPYH